MMIGLIESGNYWEAEADIVSVYDENGVKLSGPETVPLRPDADHDWDGVAWKPKNITLAEVKDREKAQARAQAARRIDRAEDSIARVVLAMAKLQIPKPADIARLEKIAAVEKARDDAIAAIDAATTKAAARDVVGKIVWP